MGKVSSLEAAPEANAYAPAPEMELSPPDTKGVTNFVPRAKLRRVDHYSRMAMLAVGKTLETVDESVFSKQDMGVIVASGYGALGSSFAFLDSYLDKGDKLAAPTHFSNSVHNAAAAHMAIGYGLRGPSLTVTQFDLSFFSALVSAQAWLSVGKCDAVLVGGVDALCEVMGYFISRFSRDRSLPAYAFGEGAVVFLVTRAGDGPEPRLGYFDDIALGRDLPAPRGETIYSPPPLYPWEREGDEDFEAGRRRQWGFSPVDSTLDAATALAEGRDITCVKKGRLGMAGQMRVCPPELVHA